MIQIRLRKVGSVALLAAAMIVPTLLPSAALAQDRRDDRGRNDRDRRSDDRRDDRNDRGYDRDRRDGGDHRTRYEDRRDGYRGGGRDDWRGLGTLGAAVGVAGLLTHNSTLAALGLGGSLYSAYRYDQDRNSRDYEGRGRYELFSHRAFDHQGHHYERRTRERDGGTYYYFQRTR